MKDPLEKIINIIHSLHEEVPVNNVSGGQIAGTKEAGDDPPVRKKKKKRPTPVGRYGSRKMWLDNLRNGRSS
tara:strand:- start:106 stop:321 length:216 start_codon:yes stop_codon:yes gene_type:complete